MTYVATINIPGYLPDQDVAPQEFETARDAWYSLYHERDFDERNYPCPNCADTMSHGVFGDCDDDSEAMEELAKLAHLDKQGSIILSTPGYDGTHDLGLAYSVFKFEG